MFPPSIRLGDATLTEEDISSIHAPQWFSDKIISFWLEHLRESLLTDDCKVAILPPNLTNLISIMETSEEISIILENHNLAEKDLIIAVVSDADQDMTGSSFKTVGSHWSLIVYERRSHTTYHIDSLGNSSNEIVARRLAEKLVPSNERQKLFETLEVSRQNNSYDCGPYVCMFAQRVLETYVAKRAVIECRDTNNRHKITIGDALALRKSILTLARNMWKSKHG